MRFNIYSYVLAFCMLISVPFGEALAVEKGWTVPVASQVVDVGGDFKQSCGACHSEAQDLVATTPGGNFTTKEPNIFRVPCDNCARPVLGVLGVAPSLRVRRL